MRKQPKELIIDGLPTYSVTAMREFPNANHIRKIGFDTALLANMQYCEQKVSEVGRETVSAVLETLSKQDAAVRRSLVGLRNVYPKHEEFQAKLSEMDFAGLALALKRLSFMAQAKVYLFWRKKQID